MDNSGTRGERHTTRAARDYVDAIKYQSRDYMRRLPGTEEIRLGKVLFTIRGTLVRRDDGNPRNAPRLRDEEATVLPEGTPVYEVAGYPASTHLAAYHGDNLHLYVARR